MSASIETPLVNFRRRLLAALVVVSFTACRTPTLATESTPGRSPNPTPRVAPIPSSREAPVEPTLEPPTVTLPNGPFWATRVESGVATYANLEVAEDGFIRGGPFGAWQKQFEESQSPAVIGSLRTTTPCVTVQPPTFSATAAKDDVNLLSLPSQCMSLELAEHPTIKARLQWYGRQPGERSVAVMQPEAPTDRPWLLVLADSLLSPAGPWLALTNTDLDADGLQDIAFVAQGVDGCDRRPCPLFWINTLMSRTHTVMRNSSSVLLTVEDYERQTGYGWFESHPLSWHGTALGARYNVEATGGKRKLAWSVLLESNELVVQSGSTRQRSPGSSRPRNR